MARIRTIKPQLFRHETLFNLEKETKLPIRIAWAGMFCVADREGRFRWKPKELKLDILPWDNLDFEAVLTALSSVQLIQKYQVNSEFYGWIPTWHSHQSINTREAASTLPGIEQATHMQDNVMHVHAQGEGKGREKEGKDACKPRTGRSFAGPLLPTSIEHLVEILGEKYLKDLREVYPDGKYLNQIISDAYMWAQDNKRKATRTPEGWRRTITTWTRKDWDKHVQNLPQQRMAVNV